MANINPTNPILPNGKLGQIYTPIIFTPVVLGSHLVSATSAPPGMNINTSNPDSFVLSGTPTQIGTFSFTITGDGDFSTIYSITIERTNSGGGGLNLPNILKITSPNGNFLQRISYFGVIYTFSFIDVNGNGIYARGLYPISQNLVWGSSPPVHRPNNGVLSSNDNNSAIRKSGTLGTSRPNT